MQSYSLEVNNQCVKFWTTDNEVIEKVIDYIQMVIDSENHRRYIHKVDKFIEVEADEDE